MTDRPPTLAGRARRAATRRTRAGRGVVPAVVGSAVAVVLALTALLVVRTVGDLPWVGRGEQAATPAPLDVAHDPQVDGAASQLRRIAARVQDGPDDVGTGTGARVDYRTWSLFTRDAGVDTRTRVVARDVTHETAADGTGTVTTTVEGDDDGRGTDVQVDGDPVERLPTTLTRMEGVLEPDPADPADPADRFDVVAETLQVRPAGPAARAALLRYVAETPGVAGVGEVIDRFGRAGRGFCVDSDVSGLPTRYLLVVDQGTGVVLGYEQMLTADAGTLDVPVPSVISYVAWRRSVFIDPTDPTEPAAEDRRAGPAADPGAAPGWSPSYPTGSGAGDTS